MIVELVIKKLNKLEFNSVNFMDIGTTILYSLNLRKTQIEALTKPLTFLKSFILDYELNSIVNFTDTFYDLLKKINMNPLLILKNITHQMLQNK